jgi:putative transposase
VRNGYHQPQYVLTSTGSIEVAVPRVNDKRTDPADRGERKGFSSAILPPCPAAPAALLPQDPKMSEVLTLVYLHGLSYGDSCPPSASPWAPRPDCHRR